MVTGKIRTNRRKTGAGYEQEAGKYLEKQGCEILQYNFYCRSGEIDIIAKDGEELVFCEVKYRNTSRTNVPLEAISFQKQRKISQTAMYYLVKTGQTEKSCRFDVIGIAGTEITWIKNAFDYTGV